jgi:CHAT domain-containing protein
VSQRLGDQQVMLEYLLGESHSMAFVVTRDTIHAVRLDIGRSELSRTIAFARGTVEQRSTLPDSLWRAPLRRLHAALIAPLENRGLLNGKRRLIIVPHAELHYLPFAALIDGARGSAFLVERYELSTTPSASVWLALGDRPARTGSGALALAPRLDELPAARSEVAAVRALVADAVVLTGRAASEDAFRRSASSARLLHFATYGVLNKQNPLFSYVELAAGALHDGRLDVHEVLGLTLVADLVVLSACETGVGSGALSDVPAGDDWIGLMRAFLHAGARRVVATLWPVQDAATGVFMQRFYRELASAEEPSAALARAQRAMIAEQGTRHPFYWAGFTALEGSNAASPPSQQARPVEQTDVPRPSNGSIIGG